MYLNYEKAENTFTLRFISPSTELIISFRNIMWTIPPEFLTVAYMTNAANTTNITSPILQNATGNLSVPEGCTVVKFEEMDYLPWDNPDNIFSAEVEQISRRLKNTAVPIFFIIGGPANVFNMAVFYKQGLKERVNLCLFALSLADELYLIQILFFYGEQVRLQFTTSESFGPLMRFMFNNNLVGFFGFYFVSQVLSAIIASERCLCVLSPLRSQTLLQTRTMAGIITGVFLVVVGFYFVMAQRYRVGCVFDPTSDTAMYTFVSAEFYVNNQELINYLDGFVYGAAIPGFVVVVVTVTTIITAVKINQAAAWRASTSSASGSSSSSSSISPQELALTRMLIGIAVLFIVCVSPLALFRLAWLFLPEMNIGRRNHNFYVTGLWFMEALSCVNSSFNFFVYYTIGSRYRETFRSLFVKNKQEIAKKNTSTNKKTTTTE